MKLKYKFALISDIVKKTNVWATLVNNKIIRLNDLESMHQHITNNTLKIGHHAPRLVNVDKI